MSYLKNIILKSSVQMTTHYLEKLLLSIVKASIIKILNLEML